MRWFIKYPLFSILMIVLGVVVQTGLKFYHKHPDALFSFTPPQTIIIKPTTYHSRFRGADYASHTDRCFFQWWNYLIFDGETRDHYNIIYQISTFANGSRLNNSASVAYGHLRGSTPINTARIELPTSAAHIKNDMDVDVHVGDTIPYRHYAVDNDTYRIQAKFPLEQSNGKRVEWDLTFTRTHSFYAGLDNEKSNIDMCLMVSTLYGYNSMVTGTITDGDVTYDITKSKRFRAYGAGSWGCMLPNGDPPADYPWTWFWIVIPGETPAQDISMVFGTAKFQAPVVNNLYGAYSATGLPGGKIVTTQLVRLNQGGSLEIPVGASSNDGYLSAYTVNVSKWATFTDDMGSADIPLVQTYHVDTENYVMDIHFDSRVDQYFRAPIVLEQDSKLRVFSDFRAVGVDTTIKIVQKATATSASKIIYDGVINTMNALEYAYEPKLNNQALKKLGFLIPDQQE